MWIQLHEDVQPVLSGSQKALKLGLFESSGLDHGTARRSSSQREGRYSVEGLLVRRPSGGFRLGSAGGRVGLGWEHTKSLLLETPCKASEADNDCNVLHQMITVLKNTISLFIQVVVVRF